MQICMSFSEWNLSPQHFLPSWKWAPRAAVLTLADIVCIYNKSRCLQGERVKGSTTRCDTPQFGLRRAATDFLFPREHSGEHSGLQMHTAGARALLRISCKMCSATKREYEAEERQRRRCWLHIYFTILELALTFCWIVKCIQCMPLDEKSIDNGSVFWIRERKIEVQTEREKFCAAVVDVLLTFARAALYRNDWMLWQFFCMTC